MIQVRYDLATRRATPERNSVPYDNDGYPAGEEARLAALGKLRKMLGDPDWKAGRMP